MAEVQYLAEPRVDDATDPSVPPRSRLRLVLVRGIVWGLIGLIYAPVFAALYALLIQVGAGSASYVPAAAIAGAAGAALYGSKEVALVGAGVGALIALCLLVALPGPVALPIVALSAAAVAAVVALTTSFPARCSHHLLGKMLAGFSAGGVGGAILALVEPLHPQVFALFAVLAFLVSVNGVLYVAGVRRWVAWTDGLRFKMRPCRVVETLVISVLAGFTAASVWLLAGSLMGWNAESVFGDAADALYRQLPVAMFGGLFGGAVAGVLLELFRFSWVHDL